MVNVVPFIFDLKSFKSYSKKLTPLLKIIILICIISFTIFFIAFYVAYLVNGIQYFIDLENYNVSKTDIYYYTYRPYFYDYIGIWTWGLFSTIIFNAFYSLFFPLIYIYQEKGTKPIIINNPENCKIIKTKKGPFVINFDDSTLSFKEWIINASEITNLELMDHSGVVAKSNIAETIVSGILFGGLGAIAGAVAGNRETFKENYKLVIKTNNPMHIVEFISAKYEDCITISETIVYMLKNKK